MTPTGARSSSRLRGVAALGRRLLLAAVLLALWATVAPLPAAADRHSVVLITAKGAVSPALAGFIDRGIGEAEARDATLVVLQLDTPGGLDSAMRDIIQRIEGSRVPVAVFVGPAGARAASAGVFITLAAHVAAMAPNTAIGAAHPVAGGGEKIEGPMGDKVLNDAVAYIRGIALLRGRNAEWAEQAVRESVSVPSDEAVALRVVDVTADDVAGLLARIDGRRVRLLSGEVTLQTRGAPVVPVEPNPIERLLLALADPNVAYLLLSLAMLGLFLEFSHPGAMLPGIFGGICLLLAAYALGMLPFNIAGLLLMGLGFLFLIAEIWITSNGLLAIGGVIALGLGSFILFSGAAPGLQVNPWLIFTVVGGLGAFFILLVGAVVRSRHRTPHPGLDTMAGARGVARSELAPAGTVLVQGELWNARTGGEAIPAGARVRVVAVDGLELEVAPAD